MMERVFAGWDMWVLFYILVNNIFVKFLFSDLLMEFSLFTRPVLHRSFKLQFSLFKFLSLSRVKRSISVLSQFLVR